MRMRFLGPCLIHVIYHHQYELAHWLQAEGTNVTFFLE